MTIYTKSGRYEVKRLSLNKVLEMIDCDHIVQIHRSFIVNTNHIDKIESVSSKVWEISFKCCEIKVPLSYKFREGIVERFK